MNNTHRLRMVNLAIDLLNSCIPDSDIRLSFRDRLVRFEMSSYARNELSEGIKCLNLQNGKVAAECGTCCCALGFYAMTIESEKEFVDLLPDFGMSKNNDHGSDHYFTFIFGGNNSSSVNFFAQRVIFFVKNMMGECSVEEYMSLMEDFCYDLERKDLMPELLYLREHLTSLQDGTTKRNTEAENQDRDESSSAEA